MDELERKMWCVDHAVKFCDTPKEAMAFARELTRFLAGADAEKEELIGQTFMSGAQVYDTPSEKREAKPAPKQRDLFEEQEAKPAHALPKLGSMLFETIMAIRSILREGGKSNFREIVKRMKAKFPLSAEENFSAGCSNLRQRGFITLETGHPDGNQWLLTESCIKQLEKANA